MSDGDKPTLIPLRGGLPKNDLMRKVLFCSHCDHSTFKVVHYGDDPFLLECSNCETPISDVTLTTEGSE